MSQDFHTVAWPRWVERMYHAQSCGELDRIVAAFIAVYNEDIGLHEMQRELHKLRRAAERTTP